VVVDGGGRDGMGAWDGMDGLVWFGCPVAGAGITALSNPPPAVCTDEVYSHLAAAAAAVGGWRLAPVPVRAGSMPGTSIQ